MTLSTRLTAPAAHRLSERSLPFLDGRVSVPPYPRRSLTTAVVHVGVGGFHRAHQAVYLDDLARLGNTGWGETGVGIRSSAMRDALVPQDGLFTVVERGRRGDTARVVGAMTRYLYAPDDPRAVVDVLADPRTRLVTLTITGNGYHVQTPPTAGSAFGLLVAALDRRRRAGVPPFTVLSCDNVPDNGAAARAATLELAELRDPRLAAWVEANAAFPASMVDRITPATDDRARRLVSERFGLRDDWPVVSEPFRQWVVEDSFCAGRPPLDEVGVEFVTDVAPYKLTKTRLLNACHSALGYLGYLAGGYHTTSDVLADPLFADYLATMMRREIAPLLPRVPGLKLKAYRRSVLERLANPRIGDELTRLCARGSTKMPAYLLPSLVQARRRGRPAVLLTLAVAGWLRYLRGYGLDGAPIEVDDAHRAALEPLARAGGADPRPLLGERWLFGELGADREFVAALGAALAELDRDGVAATLRRHLGADGPLAAPPLTGRAA